MRRTPNTGERSASATRSRARDGQLDRARIEARLGFRPSIVDDGAPTKRGLKPLDGMIALAVCIAASAPVIAPSLDPDTRVALSWQTHFDNTGAIETATVPMAMPAGVAISVRAERAPTPFWAEAKMDRADTAEPLDPAEPMQLAEAPFPEEIIVGGARAPEASVAAVAPDAVGEIVTGVVLDGPIGAGHAIAQSDAPLPMDGPLAFPTATIGGDEQPFPGLRPAPAQSMPVFRPGENPFEMDRSRREELGILDTGAIPARRARTAPPAAPMARRAQPNPNALPESIARATLGGALMLGAFSEAIEAMHVSLIDSGLDLALTEAMSGPAPEFTPLDARAANAEMAADMPDVTPSPHPEDAAAAALGAAPGRDRRNIDATIAVALTPFQRPDSEAMPAIDNAAIETASLSSQDLLDLGNDIAPRFAPRPIRDPRMPIALRADREAGVAPNASPAAQPRPYGLDTAEPFTAEVAPRPKVTIVLTAVGLNTEASNAALSDLPAAVALSIAPIAADSVTWTARAKQTGRVVLAETPMEPEAYPRVNPGPLTLLTGNSVEENVRRLGETLSRVPNPDGVATYLGGRFAKNDTAAAMFAAALERRGLMMLETVPEKGRLLGKTAALAGVTVFEAAVSIDASGHDRDIATGLRKLEEAAKRDGYAIGVGVTIPSTVSGVGRWIASLDERGIDLVALGPSGSNEPPAAVATFSE